MRCASWSRRNARAQFSMSNMNEIAPQEIASLDNLVVEARHRIAEARNLLERRTEAQGQLELARRHLTEQPSQSASDEYAVAWSHAQTVGATAAAIEEAGSADDKHVIQKALSGEQSFALFFSAWGKRAQALEGLRRTAILALADARREESAAGQLNPLLIEYAPSVSRYRGLVNTLDHHLAEARFGQKFCEAQGIGHERMDLAQMLDAVRRPLPVLV